MSSSDEDDSPSARIARAEAARRGSSGRERLRVRNTPWQTIRPFLPLTVYALVIVALIAAGAWIVRLGYDAQRQLTQVRTYVTALRADVSADDPARIELDEQELAAHAHDAHLDTRDPVWRLAAHIPGLGSDLKVAGGLADVADNLATRVLPPLTQITTTLRPQDLRRPDGSLDLAKLNAAQRVVDDALPALAAAQHDVKGLQQRVHVGRLRDARTQFEKQLADVSTSLTTASQALNLLPPMLGGNGTKRYLLVFQNLAEARGTGGLIGAYGILQASNGKLTLPIAGSDGDLMGSPDLRPAQLDLGADYAQRWQRDDPFLDWFRANLSPDWPSSAAQFNAHVDQQFHTHIDGVIGIDPLTLSYLLGPSTVQLSNGDTVSGADVPTYTMSTLYNRYGEDNPIRKRLLVELARAAFDQLQGAPGSRLLDAVKRSAAEGRLQVWSADPAQEATLATTPLGSELPSAPGSFAWLNVNNEGPKTDFFLDRSLTYRAEACPNGNGMRRSTIEVTLTDQVPPGQNAIVGRDSRDRSAPYGRGHSEVSVYAPAGAFIQGATLNGTPVDLAEGTERGHPVFTLDDLFTPVGRPQDLVIHLLEPVSAHSYTWRPQPLARAETTSIQAPGCP